MPALQVREFPDELYEELRAYAALHHRSMAQQTVAAVDQLIHGAPAVDVRGGRVIPFESAAEREGRLAKRRAIFRRAAERRASLRADLPQPETILAEARAERGGRFDELIAEVAGGAR